MNRRTRCWNIRLQTRLIRVASNRVIRKTLFRSAAHAPLLKSILRAGVPNCPELFHTLISNVFSGCRQERINRRVPFFCNCTLRDRPRVYVYAPKRSGAVYRRMRQTCNFSIVSYYLKAILATVRNCEIWTEQLNSLTALSMTNCARRNFISQNVGSVIDE